MVRTGPATPESSAPLTELPVDETPSMFTDLIRRSEQSLAAGQLLSAAGTLAGIDSGRLTPNELSRWLLLQVDVYERLGDPAAALELLRLHTPVPGASDASLGEALEDQYLQLVLNEEGPLAAAGLADQFLARVEDERRSRQLQNLIWHNLQRTAVTELREQTRAPLTERWRGWLELALLAADVMAEPASQARAVARWQTRFPDHVAATELPGGLATLPQAASNTPGRIALLLPLGAGPTERGRAVLEGFMAASYQARARGWPEQEYMIMDSARYPDLATAYDTAVRAGAELVIGPLTAEVLDSWLPPADAAVPLLALARYRRAPLTDALPLQFQLSAEDEAEQLAQLAFSSGARKAMIIRPAGAWGDRVSDALTNAWRDRHGEIQTIAVYSGQTDYSSSIKTALSLDESEARATRLRRLLAEPTEFSPRRRMDIDIVFLLSQSPQEARSIKPLIAFHYAGGLPVYASSQVFSGRRDPQRDRDLNGVNLLEIPWFLRNESDLGSTVAAGGADAQHSEAYALGADAFLLNWRLAQLRVGEESRVRGHTGLLHADTDGLIRRELVPAEFRDGVPVARDARQQGGGDNEQGETLRSAGSAPAP